MELVSLEGLKWAGENDEVIGYAAAAVLDNGEPRHLIIDDIYLPVHATAEAVVASDDCLLLARIIDQKDLTATWLDVHPVCK